MENLNINIAMAEFEANLEQLISQSQLPVGVLSYILKHYTNKIEQQYIGYVNSYYLSHESQNIAIDDEQEGFIADEIIKQGQE